MKKTAVIGLGIIGGSICRALTRAGCFVSGNDLSDEIVSYAKREGYIRERAETLSEYDTVFLAVPPRAAIALLESDSFKPNALVADVCGVKAAVEKAVYSMPRSYR